MEESVKDWMINELEINNFKSIKHINIKPGRVNVFIGKPNAGKSNLLEALAFLGLRTNTGESISHEQIRYTDMPSLYYDHNINEEIAIRAGLYRYGGCICRNLESGFEYNFPTQKRNIGVAVINNKGNFEGVSEARSTNIKKYYFSGTTSSISDNSKPNSLNYNGNNLWEIVRHNSRIKEFASDFFKDYGLSLLFDEKNKKFDIIRINGDAYYLIDFSMTPDTFRRMLYYLAAIESNKKSVILFEEPEAQSYPPYIQMLADRIVDDSHNQYFITTHSPFIVEKMLERAGNDDDGIKFFITYFEDYQTKVHELTKKEIVHIITNGIDLFFNTKAFEK